MILELATKVCNGYNEIVIVAYELISRGFAVIDYMLKEPTVVVRVGPLPDVLHIIWEFESEMYTSIESVVITYLGFMMFVK
jgi:hypothetical protein